MESQNPPPIRPWFRLASQIRVDPQAQSRPLGPLRPTLTLSRPPIATQPPQTQAPVQAPAPAPVVPAAPVQAVAPPAAPSPRLTPSAPISLSPTQASVPGSPVPKPSSPSPRTSVPSSPIPKTSPPQSKTSPMPNTTPPQRRMSLPPSPVQKPISPPKSPPPQPKMTIPPSPQSKTYSPPKASPISKPSFSSNPKPSSPFLPKQPEADEYFKLGKPKTPTTPPQSPKIKPSASPPSPLTLPPSQLNPVPEPESKSMVMDAHKSTFPINERSKETNVLHNNNTAHNKTKGGMGSIGNPMHHKKEKEKFSPKKTNEDHEEEGMRVITIAGENNGAYMELGSSKNRGNLQPQHLTKKKGNDSSSSSSSDEGQSKKKDNRMSGSATRPMKAFVNSNVQGINNSILFHSSCSHSDPGVHLMFSKKPNS